MQSMFYSPHPKSLSDSERDFKLVPLFPLSDSERGWGRGQPELTTITVSE
jgi:hypothetical protein